MENREQYIHAAVGNFWSYIIMRRITLILSFFLFFPLFDFFANCQTYIRDQWYTFELRGLKKINSPV